jgi:hypothetical protein
MGNLYSRIPGLSVLSGGVDARQRKETKNDGQDAKGRGFQRRTGKGAVIFVSFI